MPTNFFKETFYKEQFKSIQAEYIKDPVAYMKKYSRVKCGCGHYPKDHNVPVKGGSWLKCKCACNWYYPNINYIRRKKRRIKDDTQHS